MVWCIWLILHDTFQTTYLELFERNSTRSILVIDQDGLTLPGPRYYLNAPTNIDAFENNPDAVTRQYRDLIQSVITLLGGRLDNDAVKDILLFERRLAMITIPSYDPRRRSKQYVNKIGKIQDLKKLLPQIDWQQVWTGRVSQEYDCSNFFSLYQE